MKKHYETPEVKKIEFDYEENVVASGTHYNYDPPAESNTKCWEPPKCKEIPDGCNMVSDKR